MLLCPNHCFYFLSAFCGREAHRLTQILLCCVFIADADAPGTLSGVELEGWWLMTLFWALKMVSHRFERVRVTCCLYLLAQCFCCCPCSSVDLRFWLYHRRPMVTLHCSPHVSLFFKKKFYTFFCRNRKRKCTIWIWWIIIMTILFFSLSIIWEEQKLPKKKTHCSRLYLATVGFTSAAANTKQAAKCKIISGSFALSSCSRLGRLRQHADEVTAGSLLSLVGPRETHYTHGLLTRRWALLPLWRLRNFRQPGWIHRPALEQLRNVCLRDRKQKIHILCFSFFFIALYKAPHSFAICYLHLKF